jgi:hypothetical protein
LRKGVEIVQAMGVKRIFAKETKLSETIFNGL